MTLDDFINEVEGKIVDYSLGHFVHHKNKISNVNWILSETLSIKIFLCIDSQIKNILQILQDLKFINNSLKKLEVIKKRIIQTNVYIKTDLKEILIRKIRKRKENILLL